MEKLKLIFTWIFALFLLVAGINHFVKPGLYAPFIPNWLPLLAVNYFAGIIEAGLGIALLFPKTRRHAAIGVILLMVFFLPFHLVDIFRAHPAVGSRTLAFIRLPFQFVLIYWAWFILPRAR